MIRVKIYRVFYRIAIQNCLVGSSMMMSHVFGDIKFRDILDIASTVD